MRNASVGLVSCPTVSPPAVTAPRRENRMPPPRRDVGHLLRAGLLFSVTLLPFLVGGPFGASPASADDALVLPRGNFRLTTENYFYLPITQRFTSHGNLEDLGADFQDRHLDSTVFPALNNPALRALVGGVNPSIGDSQVSFEYHYYILDLGLQYGITDRLSAGFHLPYYVADNLVTAKVNSGPGSSANVGLNPLFGRVPGQPPVIPISLGGRPLSTADVQQLLGPGLPGIPGFGFKPVKTWSGDDFGDMEAGFKYQYLRTADLRLAASVGARFPTGRQDDPDDLVDIPFGLGAYAILLRLHHDYMLSNLWKDPGTRGTPEAPQPGDLILNGTFRYDWVLPERSTRRVPNDPTNAITANRERVTTDYGDRFEFELSARYGLARGLWISALYRHAFKTADEVTGTQHFAYQTLEKDTDSREDLYIVGLTYSTLHWYMEKKFPVPLSASVSFRDRFAGAGPRTSTGQILHSRYFDFALQLLF
jgi:hypothetical protein